MEEFLSKLARLVEKQIARIRKLLQRAAGPRRVELRAELTRLMKGKELLGQLRGKYRKLFAHSHPGKAGYAQALANLDRKLKFVLLWLESGGFFGRCPASH